MEREEVKNIILQEKFVVLFRHVPKDQMGDLAKALVRGGVKLLEVTYDQTAEDPVAEYKTAIAAIREAVGDDLVLGAGTVLSKEQVKATYEAGGKFIISPNTNKKVIKATKALGMVSIPGAMTPTEVARAWELGADIVKLFPADDLGYHYIWNLRGPLGHIPLMCTGGVNPETIPEFLKAGAAAVGTGASITKKELLESRDYDGIEKLARAHVEAIESFTNKD